MILTCPACATRFSLDAEALGANGRRVRCGSCRHVWHQAPPEIEHDEPPEVSSPSPPPAAAPDDAPARPIQSARRAPPPRRTGGAAFAWSALALVVILVIGGALIGKEAILEAWPESARIYAAFGMITPASVEGLELRKVSWKRNTEAEVPLLAIDGEVANTSRGVRTVPKIRAAIVGKDGRELQSWVFSPPKVNLIPGEAVPFHTELKNPPDGAERLTMAFTNGA